MRKSFHTQRMDLKRPHLNQNDIVPPCMNYRPGAFFRGSMQKNKLKSQNPFEVPTYEVMLSDKHESTRLQKIVLLLR